jgi:antitoxin Phd
MTSWPVQDAKARFSELLDACVRDGPQIVTRRGTETAVLVPVERWRRLTQSARPTLKELLLQPSGAGEMNLPPRGDARRRTPPELN